ncbi:MAG: DNA gyrase inhibitor YacG, partial [Nitrospinaceae bacterium]|nr:DNA gyrase inhibitor YacG [Nitrospinaceae bacterium]NIS84988.1 DNA gyrase inhibitor YacG [Nitrospinaceae bacterium]NIT81799.1 DNA gyrase inhibitor YacG [Nitrospinaceae bacterium]NIU96188.1 DNA gyrase inhibitor YacG [Nitrospinaceae bacterium]NIY14981.1 DNA gyrase inhibitor YacG [Nitrospinaceae bacterium]
MFYNLEKTGLDAVMNRRRRRKSQCPICNTSVQRKGNRFYPFCSERCKLVD